MDSVITDNNIEFTKTETAPANVSPLSDLQLAFVGGGIADVIGI